MIELSADKIAELKELLAKATPGEWSTHLVDDTTIISPDREIGTTCDSSQTERWDGYNIEYEQMAADAALIVAAKNALPSLLAIAEREAGAREGAYRQMQSAERESYLVEDARKALVEIDGCFQAAYAEGFIELRSEVEDLPECARLIDVLNRRIMFIEGITQRALSLIGGKNV